MPYISPEKRQQLDRAVDELHQQFVNLETDDPNNNFEGNLNYAITRLLRKCYDTSYRNINDAIGLLECIKLEHYRTIAAPYEDQKKFENGDVEIHDTTIMLNEVVVDEQNK